MGQEPDPRSHCSPASRRVLPQRGRAEMDEEEESARREKTEEDEAEVIDDELEVPPVQ